MNGPIETKPEAPRVLTLRVPKGDWDTPTAFLHHGLRVVESFAQRPRVVVLLPDRHIWPPALAVLVKLRERAAELGGDIAVACPHEEVHAVLDVSTLSSRFACTRTEEEALSRLDKAAF